MHNTVQRVQNWYKTNGIVDQEKAKMKIPRCHLWCKFSSIEKDVNQKQKIKKCLESSFDAREFAENSVLSAPDQLSLLLTLLLRNGSEVHM